MFEKDEFLEDILHLPMCSDIKVSPLGDKVAWTWSHINESKEVYVASTYGGTEPIRLTETSGNTYLVGWDPDNSSVLVKEDKDGDERYRLYRISIDDLKEKQLLTDENPNYFIRGGNITKSGDWLVYGANIDITSNKEIEATVIIKKNIKTKKKYTIAHPKRAGVEAPILSPCGKKALYIRKDRHPSGSQLYLVNIDNHIDKEIINAGDVHKVLNANWLFDGKKVVFLIEMDDRKRIGVWSEQEIVLWVVDDYKKQIESISPSNDKDKIIIKRLIDARAYYTLFDFTFLQEEAFPNINGGLEPIACLPNGKWVGKYARSDYPSDIVVFSMDAEDEKDFLSLTHVWKKTNITRNELVPAKSIEWCSSDGLKIQGWLYQSRIKSIGTIIYVHGGPTAHSAEIMDPLIQYFVNRGFNVLDPNYRGSTGFGQAFRDAIKQDGWGGMEQEDIQCGITYLKEIGISEPGKIGITGVSYGGYSAWHAITHFQPNVVSAAAPICGMTDLTLDYNTTRPDLRLYVEEMMGGTPESNPQKYHERSPINFIKNIKGKLLIAHGIPDPNVHIEHSYLAKKMLQAYKIKYEELLFEDEGHGIHKNKNRKILYKTLADFFELAFL